MTYTATDLVTLGGSALAGPVAGALIGAAFHTWIDTSPCN